MKTILKLLLFFVAMFFLKAHAGAGGIVKSLKPKVYIISIGFGGTGWKPDSTLKQIGYNNCPTCVSDANVFADYFLKIGKLQKKNLDTVISYNFANGVQLDSLFTVFNQIQTKITSKDVFIFYYSSGAWILNTNIYTGKEESVYVLNNGLTTKKEINRYGFSLRTLKQLTDGLSANNQLLIFDTGLGSVIQKDFHTNFFNANPIEASFTKKNRIIICPDNFSSESKDEKDGIIKGDIVKTITNIPDSLNILYIFDSSRISYNSNYKLMMQHFWGKQASSFGTLKIMKESEYLQVLTAIQPNLTIGTRSRLIDPQKQQIDSSIANRKKKAIIISTDRYIANDLWEDLYTPVKDGKAIAEILKNKFGYDTTFLINASKLEIQAALDEVARNDLGNPYNQYIIYFAGHGWWSDYWKKGYIVAADSKAFVNPHFETTDEIGSYFEFGQLFDRLDKLNKVILITDVCFGGTSLSNVLKKDIVVNPNGEKTIQLNAYKKIFASGVSKVDDYTRLPDGTITKNSPFALGVMDILKGVQKDISFEKLFAEVKEKVKEKKLKTTPVSKDFGTITEPNEFYF